MRIKFKTIIQKMLPAIISMDKEKIGKSFFKVLPYVIEGIEHEDIAKFKDEIINIMWQLQAKLPYGQQYNIVLGPNMDSTGINLKVLIYDKATGNFTLQRSDDIIAIPDDTIKNFLVTMVSKNTDDDTQDA